MKAVAIALTLAALTVNSDPTIWKKEFALEEYKDLNTLLVFKEWAKDFAREYSGVENAAHRYKIWLENLQGIAEHNSKQSSYKLRLNQFADLTSDEFRLKVHGKQGSCYRPGTQKISTSVLAATSSVKRVDDPTSVDWTTQGVVTPVKDQGSCGSCWAFSATGSTECNYAIATGTLNSLSEQELVDCSDSEGNEGCDGGDMIYAFEYIEKEGGLCTEDEYPYTGEDGTCKATTCGKKYDKITTYEKVTKDDATALETSVVSGCVSVGIEADQFAFQYYSSGVLDGTCGTSIDHGVLVVGYGTDGSQDYWKVKNSWGTSWGEEGYVLICRNCDKNNNAGECGINKEPSYPEA